MMERTTAGDVTLRAAYPTDSDPIRWGHFWPREGWQTGRRQFQLGGTLSLGCAGVTA